MKFDQPPTPDQQVETPKEKIQTALQSIIDGVETTHIPPEQMWDELATADNAWYKVEKDEDVNQAWKNKMLELRKIVQSLKEQYRDVPENLRIGNPNAQPTDAPRIARELLELI